MWLGDDFHHNGAFRLSYGFEYAYMVDGAKESQDFPFDRYDTYDWYLSLGPLSRVNEQYLHGKVPTWNDYVAHPDYDEFWKRQTLIPQIQAVKVPTLNVAGWWDQEDFYGPLRHLRGARAPRHEGHQLTSWSGPGITAAGAPPPATASGRSPSTARPRSTSATRSRRPGSPSTSRTRGGSISRRR